MALGMVQWITLITMMCLCCCGCSDFQTALRDDDVDVSDLDYEGDENLSDESDEEVAENKNESDTQPTFSARTPSSLEKHVVLKVGDRFPFLKTMEHQLTQIDILKIDIETSEKQLFSENYSEWLPKVKVIIIELHDRMDAGCAKSFFTAINNCYTNYTYSTLGENVIITNLDLA